MEISLNDIERREEPYQQFLDSIVSHETRRRYVNNLHSFLKLIPNEVYKKYLRKTPTNQENKTLAHMFLELAKKYPDVATNIIVAFIKQKRNEVLEGKISSSTVSNHKKPITALLDSNGVLLPWKQINKILPRRESLTKDRAYTKQELQRLMEVAHDLTDKVIITMATSAGFRKEAWDYFVWDDYIIFKNKDDSIKGGALRIYRGDPEEYWTHLTPESCKYLEMYKQQYFADIGRYPNPDDPLLRVSNNPRISRLHSKAVQKRVQKIVTQIGLRPHLPEGIRRHEVQLMHGFRKYFHTMMRRAKVNYLDMEDMMGHKIGLEKHYERYQEEDFERFSEYQKAISFLTISEEEQLRYENLQKQKELDGVENNSIRIKELKIKFQKEIDDLKYGPSARGSRYAKGLWKEDISNESRIFAKALALLFEFTIPEEKKRAMMKELEQASIDNRKPDLHAVFGTPKLTEEQKNQLRESIKNYGEESNTPKITSKFRPRFRIENLEMLLAE